MSETIFQNDIGTISTSQVTLNQKSGILGKTVPKTVGASHIVSVDYGVVYKEQARLLMFLSVILMAFFWYINVTICAATLAPFLLLGLYLRGGFPSVRLTTTGGEIVSAYSIGEREEVQEFVATLLELLQ